METQNQNPGAQEISTLTATAPGAGVPSKPKNDAVDNLKPGETLLVKARGVKGGKVELEFAEQISNPNKKGISNPLVALLNASDDRFSANKARRGWITGTATDIQKLLGIDVSSLTLGQEIVFNKLNPTLGGERLRLQVVETTKADEYQAENIDTTAKRAGKDGDFITHKGMYIFANVYVVPCSGEVKHTWLEADETVSATAQGIKAVSASASSAASSLAV